MNHSSKDLCYHCGASMMKNHYSFNRVILRALVKLFRSQGIKSKDLNLTKSEYANFTKLKHWGLIWKQEDGLWFCTKKAEDFLSGKIKIPKEIYYFRNKVIEEIGHVGVYEIIPTEESKQKYREMMRSYL